MSLNLPPNGYYPQQFDMRMNPTAWTNNVGYNGRPEMYPNSGGMMPMPLNNGKKLNYKPFSFTHSIIINLIVFQLIDIQIPDLIIVYHHVQHHRL